MNESKKTEATIFSFDQKMINTPSTFASYTHFHTYLAFNMVCAALLYAVNLKKVTMVIIKHEYLPAFVKVHYYQVVSVTISIVRFY